ncbi:CDP-glycerol glycerophosphotransferase family protein [Actinomadura craniellae]|uniref:CDP-glycerol glycerophosphotransferase family protein n=1 Tax=Actinomadura craniellae TaxID=2231787 RepID=UPI001F37ADE4|nr:CDP-glycerol glycerophosphotransferase family protein [Actinomadura craniellae]
MPHQISVVVLAHGAKNALGETLESLAAQTHERLEVLVIDDGTGTAGTTGLPDERFRLIRQGAPSRGAGRNLGAAAAEGEYLAFVDGGDTLPPDALEVLHAGLVATGSDLATGQILMTSERGMSVPRTLKETFAEPRPRTDVRRHPDLLQDRLIVNKLFRRSFWDRHRLEFPDLSRYEDLAVVIPALHLADSVDVLTETVTYLSRPFWPERTTEPQEIADGFAAVASVAERLDGVWSRKDLHGFQLSVLKRELRVFIDGLPDASDEERLQIVEQAAAYTGEIEDGVFAELSALNRLKWHLASRRLKNELVKVVRFERGKTSPAIVRDPVRRYVVYPYWKDEKLAVPRSVYRARDEVALRGQVHEVAWRDGKMTVTGEAYINSVSMRRRWTSVKGVALRSGKRRVPVRARQTPKPGKSSGPWTGFEFTLDPRRLQQRGRWVDGRWDVRAAVFNAGVYRSAKLRGGKAGTGAHPPYHYVTDDVRIVPVVVDERLYVDVETVRVRATGLRWSDDGLEIAGTGAEGVPEVVLTWRGLRVPAEVAAGEGGAFTARVGVAALHAGEFGPDSVDDTRNWKVLLGDRPLVLAEEVADAHRLVGSQQLVAGRDASGYVRVQLQTARLAVASCEWRADGTLALTGTHPSYAAGEIVLRSKGRRKEHAFTMVADGGTLRAEVPAAAVASPAGVLPLRQGRWDVLFRPTGTDGPARALAVRLEKSAATGTSVEVALRGYFVEDNDGRLVVRATNNLRPEERGAGTKMRDEARRRAAKDGLRDTVLYSCFNGRQYSDSPKAIHEELLRRGTGLEHLWVVNDAQTQLPDTLQEVRLNGQEWHEALASSRYIVTNHRLGDWFQRHPDQVVLQTWHGTPLKKIGRDMKEIHFAYAPGLKKALQSNGPKTPQLPEWTHLLSPNPFSTEIFRRAFGFKGEIIEAGYPRNDLLYSPDAEQAAAQVRARLGLPAGKKVVLYAPTWRDDQYYSRGRYKFDMRLDLARAKDALGDDHVLLIRLHSNVVDGVAEDGNGFVYDVSLYPDITELYLIADMMITDYSSVMFDYANTRRPMLFFTYDLPDYRDRLRGFYFDFENESPGPLVETSDDLIEAIRAGGGSGYEDRYAAFVERFCPLDDGKASARVVDQVFPG